MSNFYQVVLGLNHFIFIFLSKEEPLSKYGNNTIYLVYTVRSGQIKKKNKTIITDQTQLFLLDKNVLLI